MLLLLLACAQGPDAAALDARFAAVAELQALDAARIDALELRIEQLEAAALTTSGGAGDPAVDGEQDVAAPYLGSHCDPDGDGWVLPPKGEITPDALAASGRIVPHKAADGAVDGFRVSGIRRGSLLDSCGVRNGDIVQKADGMPLLTVEALTAAFAATQERQSFTISLVRRGVPVELRLRWPS